MILRRKVRDENSPAALAGMIWKHVYVKYTYFCERILRSILYIIQKNDYPMICSTLPIFDTFITRLSSLAHMKEEVRFGNFAEERVSLDDVSINDE